MPLYFKKKFGQHFLRKPPKSLFQFLKNILEKRFKTLLIVETGPGEGALTYPVLNFLKIYLSEVDMDLQVMYYAFEVDRDLTPRTPHNMDFNKQYVGAHNAFIHYHLLYEDILKVNLTEFLRHQIKPHNLVSDSVAIIFISSLPYYISKEIVIKQAMEFCELRNSGVGQGYFWYIAQKEVAESFLSKPPDATFLGNVIRLFVDQVYKGEVLSRHAFVPPPKVDSLVFWGEYKSEFGQNCVEIQNLINCIKRFFQYSRKKIGKICKIFDLPVEDNLNFINKRPQELTSEEWYVLCRSCKWN